jgi:signal transduction histidine kinase
VILASTSKTPIPFTNNRRRSGHNLFDGYEIGAIRVVGRSSWTETEEGIRQLGLVLGGLWLPLVFLTGAIAWYGGGLILRPVTELVNSADHLSLSTKSDLLATSDKAEFAALADSLNLMISRIRSAAEVQEQFASDAAHELRSPLALLRTRVETTLLRDRSSGEYIANLKSMIGQIDRLTSIVETLLASARHSASNRQMIHLDVILPTIIEQWSLESDWPMERLQINLQKCEALISEEELRIIIGNLADNASRYSPEGKPIVLTLERVTDRIHLAVRDFGPGLTKERQAKAFDRFYRSDDARGRDHGGAGIGLAVVKRIVESCGGEVGFRSEEPGTTVWFTLPVLGD